MKSSLFTVTTPKKSFAQKMSLMAGTAAVLAFPEAADAAIVHVTGSPITAFTANNDTIDWDIDQNLTPDANLIASTMDASFSPAMALSATGGGANFLAGPGAAYFPLYNIPTNYSIGNLNVTYENVGIFTLSSQFVINTVAPTLTTFHFQDDVPGFIGFTFQPGATQLFGWASVTIDLGNSVTINEWAYDDTGAPIQVGDTGATATTPEGDNVAGLALLGMGAAGIRAWRKRKQLKLEQDKAA